MTQTSSGNYRKQKWYNNNIFPLVPVLDIKKANKHNTSGFTFRWLFFTLWTIDSFSFEFAITADNHWGIGLKGLFPFFRWVVAIPCPEKASMWVNNNLDRKVKP